MKRFLLILITLITFSAPVLVTTGTAAAVDVFQSCNGAGSGSAVCQDAGSQEGNNGNNNPVIKIIKAAINVLSYIIGAAAIIGLVVSGIRLMTAGGDSQAVASARSAAIYSLIGIAVVILAQALVAYVLNKV
jgi:hypothetical protein